MRVRRVWNIIASPLQNRCYRLQFIPQLKSLFLCRPDIRLRLTCRSVRNPAICFRFEVTLEPIRMPSSAIPLISYSSRVCQFRLSIMVDCEEPVSLRVETWPVTGFVIGSGQDRPKLNRSTTVSVAREAVVPSRMVEDPELAELSESQCGWLGPQLLRICRSPGVS